MPIPENNFSKEIFKPLDILSITSKVGFLLPLSISPR